MRNIAEIIEDDKNGKQLSQTERQIAVAYIQGKYDAVRELKIGNVSNAIEVLDKIKAEIDGLTYYWCEVNPRTVIDDVIDIIDKYRAENKDEVEE